MSAVPTMSVVIACRNSASTLAATLEALAEQKYPGWWEVLIVDNGSTDNTAALAERFGDRFPNYTVLCNPNPGYQARAINYGVEHSKGECLAFLDSDDLIGADYLLHMGHALAWAPVVAASVDVALLNQPEVRERRDLLQADHVETFFGYLPAVVGGAMGIRRQPLDAVGGWDDSLPTQHDLDVSWRLHRAGHEATFVPEAVLHYRYRDTPLEIFRQELGYGEGEVALYRKHRQHGLRRKTLPRVLVAYARLIIALVDLPRSGGPARFATALGANLGRLVGSARLRTWYL